MMHYHNLWYLLMTYLSHKRLLSPEKLPRTSNIFGKILNRLMSTYLPYTLNYIQYRLLCVTQATYREIKVIAKSWKSPKDVLMRRPATYFATVLNRIMSTNLPNTLNCLQYSLLCVTQATYRAIKGITESWESSQGRPYETSWNKFCDSLK